MKKNDAKRRIVYLLICFAGIAIQGAIFTYFYFMYYATAIANKLPFMPFYKKGHALIILMYLFLYFIFAKMYGGFKVGQLKNIEIVVGQLVSLFFVSVIEYLEISLLCFGLIYPWNFVRMSVEQMLVSVIWVIVGNWIYRYSFPPRKLLLVHGDRPIEEINRKFESRKDKFTLAGFINISEGFENICKRAEEGFEGVVIWDIPSDMRNKVLKYCYGRNLRVYIMPKISDVILSGAEQLHLFDSPILLTREEPLRLEERAIKRLIDIVCSLILIVISSPFMLVTAIAVKLYDGGPILYKQIRCTKGAKEFKICKFRSMRVDAEKDGVARLAKANDDRITPVGHFIRKCRLDELPQLFNILKGDMSFIGPRPERPEIIKQYLETMPEFAFRMKVKAGLAGYAQVYGKYNTTPYDKLKLDLCYIENYSLWLDIKLMMLTIKVLFMPDATEGVGDQQVTALIENQQKEPEEQQKQ